MAMIEQARLDGARLVTGGARLGGPLADGYFIEPTVCAVVADPRSDLAQREVFGPVLGHHAVPHREEDAIAIANGTEYGNFPHTSRPATCAGHTGSPTNWSCRMRYPGPTGRANLGVH